MTSESLRANEVTAMRAKSASIEARISSALSKDEALSLAMEAAELCMRALKIATKDQKSSIRSRCESLLNEAERIKSTKPDDWIQVQETDLISTTGHSLRSTRSNDSSPNPQLISTPPLPAETTLEQKPTKRLKEPTSTRELTRAEQIILLRGAKLNGFQFPPWKGPPHPQEFELRDGEEAYKDSSDLCLSRHQLDSFDGWRRAQDAIPPPSWFPGDRTNLGPTMESSYAMDLVQDAATDCSVVASMCAGASRVGNGHPKMIGEMMYPFDHKKMHPKISANGKYVIRLNFNGCFRKVVIDDRLPVSKSQRLLHIIDRKNPTLLWPALLEKAYLKVRGGYDFPGSNSSTDLWILTGWIPEQIFLQDDTTDPSSVWKRIINAFQYGDVLVTMGTGKMSHRLERDLGLAGQHDYAVLDIKEDREQKFVLLKNPWCEGTSWKGSIPQSSPLSSSTSSSASLLGTDQIIGHQPNAATKQAELPSGTFWIDWNNVLQHFDQIFLNWNSGLFSHRQDIHFSWDLTHKRSAAGSFVNNPQFAVLCEASGTVWLLLCRHFKDTTEHSGDLHNVNIGPSGEFIGHMSLYVYDGSGQRVHVSSRPMQRSPYVDSPQTLVRLDVPFRTTYTVVVSEQEMPQIHHTFSLMAFSSMPVQLSQATDRFSFSSAIESSWTSATAGGGAHILTYSSNPQFSLVATSRTTVALLLETPNPDLNVHIKLVHGGGKRIISITQRDILIDSGEYRRGSAYAEIAELDAGSYTIICSTFEAGQKAGFTVRVDSSVQTQLKQLPSENAGRLSKTLPVACFNWNNNKIAALLAPRRLIKLTSVAKFRSSSGPSTRSPVRLSIELGRGPTRQILAVSALGEYLDADGGGVRTPELDIWPQMRVQYAELWLVLERMACPGVPGEESFDVEVWCDGRVEEVCELGNWRKWDD